MAQTFERLRRTFERLLELIVIALMVILATEVSLGTAFRTFGAPLVWYDEVASVFLAWLTYYGSALAAMKRAHIGFPGLLAALPVRLRLPLAMMAEALVIAFFALLAWVGWEVLGVLSTDTLVTLPEVSVMYTQSVIPIGAVLFIMAELFNLPRVLREARGLAPRDAEEGALELTH